MSLAMAGTFRLDNGHIKITLTGYTGVSGTTTYTTTADIQTNIFGGNPLPYGVGTESDLGAYSISGTTLTLTRPGSSTPLTYTKQ